LGQRHAPPHRQVMTVEWLDVSDITPRIAYTATAGQTVFPVPFPFLDETHLKVYVNGVLKTLSTHYATSGEEDEDGGTVTLVTSSSLNDSIVIERDLAYELRTHIPTAGNLDVPAINLQFSLFVMMLQQAMADLPRSLRQPSTDVEDIDAMPVAASRANKYLFFDADGQPTMVSSVSASVAASAYILTLMTAADAAAARTTLGITDQSAYTGLSNWHHCR
jgi:hypothetical protein